MDYKNAFIPLTMTSINSENQVYSDDEKKNKEFIDYFVSKHKLQLLESIYYNSSSYYYNSKEFILYNVQHGFSKYNSRLIFKVVTDNKILEYNGIHMK